MEVDCISDIHGYLPDLLGGDVLIIAGDLILYDTQEEYDRFQAWLLNLPYRCKIVIAGNHDGLIEKGKINLSDPSANIHYLCDSGTDFEGFKIWGSPYTPTFGNWHFMENRGEAIKKHWDLIPDDIDILVTHGPPYGIFDETIEHHHVGCEELIKAVQERVKPRLHCFGHIHEGGGKVMEKGGVIYANCSYVNEYYHPVHSSIHFNLIKNS